MTPSDAATALPTRPALGGTPPPRTLRPLVSVVVVLHGGRDLLESCVEALRANTEEHIELLILDSASPDGTGEWARERFPELDVRLLGRNVGFGAASNAGVLASAAPYVCFLNADATVQPGWLPPLLDALERRPDVAAVGPAVLDPDGAVQEAGSLVDARGATLTWTGDEIGAGLRTMTRREVDYASGACLLVRRAAFTAVGGFSADYHIAYYEDVDFAFAARRRGLTVLVEPRSTVLHRRHGLSGSRRAAELTLHNRAVFVDKWGADLTGRDDFTDIVGDAARLFAARDVQCAERVLVIDDRVPNADRGSGDPRTLRLVEALVAPGRLVTYLARDSARADEYAPSLRELGVEVVWDRPDAGDVLAARHGVYDVVIVSRPSNWEWAADAIERHQPRAVRVYDAEALFHRRLDQLAATDPAQLAEARRVRDLEAAAFRWADVGLCITDEEAAWARTAAPETDVELVGYPVRTAHAVPGRDGRAGLAFFGGFMAGPGSPNEVSVLDVMADVWPELRRRHPELRLRIVGADPTPAVTALTSSAIDVVGKVDDPAVVLGQALVHVAPMRFGAGMKLKFVDSMAAGLPFVTTPLGAEGLRLGDLARHLVATSSAETIELADRLLVDAALWTHVHDGLLAIVREHFSVDAFGRSVDAVLTRTGLLARPAR